MRVKNLGICVEGKWLIRNLNFTVHQGEFLAVRGSSGSGKTTLLRVLSGSITPDEGKIEKENLNSNECAMIFQDLQLADGATAITNALSGCLGRNSFLSSFLGFTAQEKKQAIKLLNLLGLSDKLNQWTSTLSRGERQRLAIVRSLFSQPRILLADEPTSSLDEKWAKVSLELIKKDVEGRNGSVICSLHDSHQARDFSNRELFIDSNSPENWSIQDVESKKS